MRRLWLHWRWALFVLAILLVAYGVRVHQLGAQSLWYDEGVAYGHSQRALLDMLPLLQRNVHVPAYFWSLAVWEDVAGSSEFALRYLSVMFSVVSVALAYALGKRLYGRGAGAAAAGFVALNTFSIYYAQEARMYAMLAAVAAASMWLFVGWTRAYLRQRAMFEYALALAITNAVGMYTHFSYGLVMVSQGIIAVWWLLSLWAGAVRLDRPRIRERSRFVRSGMEPVYTVGVTLRALMIYIVINLITIALFSPWITVALRQTSSQPNISDVVPPEQLLRVLQGWYSFGLTFEQTLTGIGVALYFFLLFGLIILPQGQRGHVWRMLVPVIWLVASSAIYAYLGLYERYLRFLLPAQIAAALWMARGVWVLWRLQPRRQSRIARFVPRFAAVFATGALWATMAQGIPHLYEDPRYQRDDYRALARQVAAETTASDTVVLSAPGLGEIFGYYYRGSAPVVLFPLTSQPATEAETIAKRSGQIAAVLYGEREQDAAGSLEAALNARMFPLDSRWWGDVRHLRFASPRPLTSLPAPNAGFGSITLVTASLSSRATAATDPLLVELTWQTAEPQGRYKVFVQLLNSAGQLAAQRDSEPANGTAPTDQWQPDERVTDRHALDLSSLPPGDYTLIVGLYDPATGIRLPVGGGDYLALATITITPGS
jgi:uncharacterized membrane protein